jgi:hypothetical protein
MILIDVRLLHEHAKVNRSNIGPESADKCGDVQNEPI